MLMFSSKLATLKRDEKGMTALEYSLITALITLMIVGAVSTTGASLNAMFVNVGDQLSGVLNQSSTAPAGR